MKSIAIINWVSILYLAGTIVGLYFLNVLPSWLFTFGLALAVLIFIRYHKNSSARQFFVLALVLLLSLFRTTRSLGKEFPIGTLTVRGFVSEPPLFLERVQRFPLKTDWGTVLVTSEGRGRPFSYGDILEVSGDFKRRRNVAEVRFPKIVKLEGRAGNPLFALTYTWRERFKETLFSILPPSEAAVSVGILLGTQGVTDRALMENLRITGTTHIISVSGYNISIIITGLIIALSFVSTEILLVPLLLIVLLFDSLVGFTPPVVRATLMGIMIFLGRAVGRQRSTTDALLLSAALIAFFDPQALLTTSFQLSFLATAGIIYLYPYIIKLFKGWPALIGEDLAVTFSAQLAVLPVIVYYFGTISLVSPLSNLLVGWTIPALMVLSFLTGFLGQIWLPLGQLFGALDLVLLNYFVKVIEVLSKVPWASVTF